MKKKGIGSPIIGCILAASLAVPVFAAGAIQEKQDYSGRMFNDVCGDKGIIDVGTVHVVTTPNGKVLANVQGMRGTTRSGDTVHIVGRWYETSDGITTSRARFIVDGTGLVSTMIQFNHTICR